MSYSVIVLGYWPYDLKQGPLHVIKASALWTMKTFSQFSFILMFYSYLIYHAKNVVKLVTFSLRDDFEFLGIQLLLMLQS